jgi:hypothetical protein
MQLLLLISPSRCLLSFKGYIYLLLNKLSLSEFSDVLKDVDDLACFLNPNPPECPGRSTNAGLHGDQSQTGTFIVARKQHQQTHLSWQQLGPCNVLLRNTITLMERSRKDIGL